MKVKLQYSYQVNPEPGGYYFIIYLGEIEVAISSTCYPTKDKAAKAAEEEIAWRLKLVERGG